MLRVLFWGIVLSAWGSSQALGQVSRTRAAYLTGYSSRDLSSVSSRCLLVPNDKLRFCREGYAASQVFHLRPHEFISQFIFLNTGLFAVREGALGYGIGFGENIRILGHHLEEDLRLISMPGLKLYFFDGLGMGFFKSSFAGHAAAIKLCRTYGAPWEQALCFFGLGRASVFAQSLWFESEAYGISALERYHLQQGYFYARIYANDERVSQMLTHEPGVLAAAQSLHLKAFSSLPIFEQQRRCIQSVLQHHYLCALQILRPDILLRAL